MPADRILPRTAQVAPRAGLLQRWSPLAFLGGTLLLPPAVAYVASGVGFVGGAMVVCMLLLGGCLVGLTHYPRQIKVADVILILALIAFFIVAHFTAALYANATITSKSTSSLGLLLIEGAAIPALIAVLFVDAHDEELWFAGRVLRYVFLISAILGVLGISPATDSVGAKPLFPFTEPSYWGFTFVPVLIFTSVRSRPLARLVWLGLFLVATVLIQNWTMMLCCLLAITVSLPNWAAVPAGVIGALGLFGIDLSYYAEHLNFDLSTTESQSALVYVQGWQMLDESLRHSHWWGLGLQQMGYQYTAVPATFRINALYGYDLNLQDGGFLLSKLGSEFGIFGIAFSGFAIFLSIRAFLVLRAELSRPVMSNARLLAYSSCFGILVELLVRGGNYFSGSLMLYVASMLFLWLNRRSDLPLWRWPVPARVAAVSPMSAS